MVSESPKKYIGGHKVEQNRVCRVCGCPVNPRKIEDFRDGNFEGIPFRGQMLSWYDLHLAGAQAFKCPRCEFQRKPCSFYVFPNGLEVRFMYQKSSEWEEFP